LCGVVLQHIKRFQFQNIRIYLEEDEVDGEQKQKSKSHVFDDLPCAAFGAPHIGLTHVEVARVCKSQYREDGAYRNSELEKAVDEYKKGNEEKLREIIIPAEIVGTVYPSVEVKEDCLKKLGGIHNNLQRIHPFSDGNSRTTRMLLNWVLIKHDLPIIVLKMGSFNEYMSLTKLSNKRDDASLNNLFLEVLTHENLNK